MLSVAGLVGDHFERRRVLVVTDLAGHEFVRTDARSAIVSRYPPSRREPWDGR